MHGIRDPGFDLSGTLSRLEAQLREAGVALDDQPLNQARYEQLELSLADLPLMCEDVLERGCDPTERCRTCALLNAHWRIFEYVRRAERSEPWVALAEAAQLASKHVRAARRLLDGPSRRFDPIAVAIYADWQRRLQNAKQPPVDNELIWAQSWMALAALHVANECLGKLSSLNTRVPEAQLSQRLGRKPGAPLLFEIEATLSTGLEDEEIVDIVREGGDHGRMKRFRQRHELRSGRRGRPPGTNARDKLQKRR